MVFDFLLMLDYSFPQLSELNFKSMELCELTPIQLKFWK